MNKILQTLENHSQNQPQKIALSDGKNLQISYEKLWEEISKISQFLRQKNLSSLAILCDNSPHFIAFDLACLQAKITLTPIPNFFSKEQILNLLKESAIEAVLSDNIFSLPIANFREEKITIFAQEFSLFFLQEKYAKNFADDICKITFTSGSTQNPKGVCLKVQNLETVVFALYEKLKNEELKINLSLLPLSVLLENIAGVYVTLMLGECAIIMRLEDIGITNSSSFDAEKFILAINKTQPNSIILVPELAKLVLGGAALKKINNPNFKFIAVGGAKVANDLLQNAKALGLPFYQGYGLSEFSSVVALNCKESNKIGSVGKILPHVNLKFSSDGEILLQGNLADGYSDSKPMDIDSEGFYKTGDIGYLDEEGFLFIKGRKKNIFITSFGRNVNPEWIESELLKNNFIAQALVFGEAMPKNIAIVTTSLDETSLQNEVDKINKTLPDYAQIGKIIITKEPFSLKNNLLTGNGRIRRSEIINFYQNQLFI